MRRFAGRRLDARNCDPSKSLTVSSRLNASGFVVVDDEVTDVSVATKGLDWHIRSQIADGAEECSEGAAGDVCPHGVVPNDHEQINWLLKVDGIEKPLFLNQCLRWDDL